MSNEMMMVAARISLYHIVSSLNYLAKQGLAIRGKTDSTANFNELLDLRATVSESRPMYLLLFTGNLNVF